MFGDEPSTHGGELKAKAESCFSRWRLDTRFL